MGEYADIELDYYTTKNYGFSIFGYNDRKYKQVNRKRENKMVEYTTVFTTGKLFWAKVFKPVLNYDRDGKEWTVDVVLDDISFLKEHRLLDRLKEGKEPMEGDYIRLKKPELNKDGVRNEPIKVYDADNKPWNTTEMGLIGNGSAADIKLTIADFGKGKKKAIWVAAIRVTDLIPHEGGTQDPFAEFDGDKKAKPTAKKGNPKKAAPFDELEDDEIPF